MTSNLSDTSATTRATPSEDDEIQRIIAGAWDAKVKRAGIPPRYRNASCELGTKIYHNAETGDMGAFLYGPPGTGKTHAACVAALEALRAGKDARYITTCALMEAMRDEFSEQKWVSRQVTGAWLLVLDEAGEGDGTDWAVSQLFDLINRRYNEMLPTVICSNYSPQELMQLWHVDGVRAQRVMSRIAEVCVIRHLDGEDRRLHGHASA